MPARVHPALYNGRGVWIAQSDIFTETTERISDELRAGAESWRVRFGKRVRHFVEARHVGSLDLCHSVQSRTVGKRSQSLMLPLSVDEIEDARFRCAKGARTLGIVRRRRRGGRSWRRDWYYAAGYEERGGRCEKTLYADP